MTSEEMQRAIDFLLKSLATLEARIEQVHTNLSASIKEVNTNLGESISRTDEQIAQTNAQLREYANTQVEFIEVMTRTWEAQGLFNSSMRKAYRKLAQKVDRLLESTGGAGGE
jgi:chromosome segregation ATPase